MTTARHSTQRAREYGRRMTSAAVFMDRMLRDLLELSRITKSALHLETVSVAEAWKSALAQNEKAIQTSGARIDAAAELGHVTANPTLLQQILANLLGNALKFTRPNTPPHVKVWSEQIDAGTVAIFVEDNGIEPSRTSITTKSSASSSGSTVPTTKARASVSPLPGRPPSACTAIST